MTAISAISAKFLGICTDRSDGEVRFVVSGASIDDVKAQMNFVLKGECDIENGETFDPFDWTDEQGNGPIIEWAINATDDFAQILLMS